MSKKQKNLSLNLIKEQNTEKYKNKKRVHFDDGLYIDVDTVFQPVKIENVINEFGEILQEVGGAGKSIDIGASLVIIATLLIKHMTSLETEAADYNGILELAGELKNGEYFDKIIESFDEVEREKAFEKIASTLEKLKENLEKLASDNAEEVVPDEVVQ